MKLSDRELSILEDALRAYNVIYNDEVGSLLRRILEERMSRGDAS